MHTHSMIWQQWGPLTNSKNYLFSTPYKTLLNLSNLLPKGELANSSCSLRSCLHRRDNKRCIFIKPRWLNQTLRLFVPTTNFSHCKCTLLLLPTSLLLFDKQQWTFWALLLCCIQPHLTHFYCQRRRNDSSPTEVFLPKLQTHLWSCSILSTFFLE